MPCVSVMVFKTFTMMGRTLIRGFKLYLFCVKSYYGFMIFLLGNAARTKHSANADPRIIQKQFGKNVIFIKDLKKSICEGSLEAVIKKINMNRVVQSFS